MYPQEEYRTKLKLIYSLLSDGNEYIEDINSIRQSFMKGYYDILRISFDLNVSNEELERITWSGKVNSKGEVARLIIDTIENESSYILLNDYLDKVIELLYENKRKYT